MIKHGPSTGSSGGHGRELRGLAGAARSSTETGKFGRMFRWLPAAKHSPDAIHQLAEVMIQGEFAARRAKNEPKLDTPITEHEPEDENPTVSAGFTYLGQFIDHDITFDPASSLQTLNDPDALVDFRTPRFDLDSVYGRGRADAPFMYDDPFGPGQGLKFTYGPDQAPPGVKAKPDHPRNAQSVAIIGDKRNDENIIVGQIHTLFKQFHDRVVDQVRAQNPHESADDIFAKSQQLVRWHYQWIILNEYLPNIVGKPMAEAVLRRKLGSEAVDVGPNWQPDLRFYRPRSGEAYMPVEFAVAAFRFGHSMVRPSYSLSETVVRGSDSQFNRIPIFSDKVDASGRPDPLANLNGFGHALPGQWGIDWRFFFSLGGVKDFVVPQPSYRIDTVLVDPHAMLPEFKAGGIRSLAERNLLRGMSMSLPSGQSVARAMGLIALTDAQLWSDSHDTDRDAKLKKLLPQFAHNAPLWYYILKEAELTRRAGASDPEQRGGHHLGPVGGRIVAEVLVGLAWHDHFSYLFQAHNWRPDAPWAPRPGQFGMADLVRAVEK